MLYWQRSGRTNLDDVRDALASLFAGAGATDSYAYADKVLALIRDHREVLFFSFGLDPNDATTAQVLDTIRRHYLGVSKAISMVGRVVTFPCPYCGTTVSVTRKAGDFSSPITVRCCCGRTVTNA